MWRKYDLHPKKNISWLRLFGMLMISSSLIGIGVFIGKNLPFDLNTACLENGQKWSPLLEVDNSYHSTYFNGSLMKQNVFRLPAGQEVDEAWESLGVNYRALAVPESQAVRSGLHPNQVQINPAYGGGYPANVEGLHHLHCLNLVRKALYYNIDYYRSTGKGAFINDDHIVQLHVSHCLDIIRQQLICTPNTGLMGQIWWDPSSPKAFVDFNTQHKCKNFKAIREWARERQLPENVPRDFLQPPSNKEAIQMEIP